MKKIMLLASVCLMLNHVPLLAQTASTKANTEKKGLKTYKAKLGNSKDSRVVITIFNSNVQVIGTNSDEVTIEGSGITPPPARAAGLKPLYNMAEDNTGLGLAVTKENNTMRITKASRQEGDYVIRVPKNAAVVYEETNWMGGDVSVADVGGEIELKLNNGNATLTNVSGPVIANTTAGDIIVKFSSLNQSKPSAISNVAGTVDITLPASTKADFKLRTVQGEVYTDFDMNLNKNAQSDLTKIAGGNSINGKTNGGGVEMSIYNVSGDVFIRKGK
ncbi:DUF4097 family beta strand repeat-containing protein [Pontibacter chitinilyticus]|uniref:DUF4097 family beta strand repeat-containing protein n=1 Tax=Pontibacter chitinilyticus TaxID=2674989 RepID=UPI00321BE707